MNDRKKAVHVGTVVLETVKGHLWLSLTILAVVAGAVGAALVPPLVLGRIVDGLTAGERLTLRLPLWYLAFTALAGGLESARESALTVFGQKTTHALRSRLMEKEGRLPADELNRQEPGRWCPASWGTWTRWRPCSPPGSSVWRRTPAGSSVF